MKTTRKLDKLKMKKVALSIDEVGELFFYENSVFRAINDAYIPQVKEMFDNGLMEELTSKKLFPKTWISDVEIAGYSLVLEHENITNWNYAYEWSFDMLKDAALLVLEINQIANKYAYQLMDGHASNVVFNMNKAQYIDFGSFVSFDKKSNSSWESYTVFYVQFYIPLYLWSKSYPDVARNIFLMRDYFSEKEFFKLKYPLTSFFVGKHFSKLKKIKTLSLNSEGEIRKKIPKGYKQSIALVLAKLLKSRFSATKLKNKISNFTKPQEPSMWNDYHNTIEPKTNKRFLRVIQIIKNLKDAETLVELGSNQGKFASLISEETQIKKIIATDYDKEAVNIMYLNTKNKANFLVLLFDMVRTIGRKCDKDIKERIKSDIVISLAVTHHLILTQKIPIDYIFETMKSLSNKYIIVEFMPIGLYGGDLEKVPALPDYYNLAWFKANFTKHFELILDEKLELNRHVFVGKIKK